MFEINQHQEIDYFSYLPDELVLLILGYLKNANQYCNCSSVCKRFYQLYKEDSLWRPLWLRERGFSKEILPPVKSNYFLVYSKWKSQKLKKLRKIREDKLRLKDEPPSLLDFIKLPYLVPHLVMFLLIFLITGCNIQKFFELQYMDSQTGSFGVGIDDLAVVYMLLTIGPFACNLFQVFVLKPILVEFLGEDVILSDTARERFYNDGWLLGVVLLLNIFPFISFSSSELFCAWFPWFCDTGMMWWGNYPLEFMSRGCKWFCLITIASDGYSVLSALIEIVYYKKVRLSEYSTMILAYILLLYSYFNGYMRVACAILIQNNFTDAFLYFYKMVTIKEFGCSLSVYVSTVFSMALFVLFFVWTKVINAPKIIFSILFEAPRFNAITHWGDWLAALSLVGGMEIIYLHWILLLIKPLIRT